jgi:flavin reductase (DIM6/NTAB) family NADH-FMN oxidoreductase RutF
MICLAKDAYTSKLIKTAKQFAINIPAEKILRKYLFAVNTRAGTLTSFKRAN